MDKSGIESCITTNKATLYSLLIIVCFAAIPYLNTFHSPFIFDDIQNIVENNWIKIKDISIKDLSQAVANSPLENRALPNLSFALNYYIGGLNVWGYHFINLLLHLSVSVVLFFLIRLTLTTNHVAEKCKRPQEIALLATILWAVHPLQTNAVTYIVQRMTSMATLFFLISLFLFVKGYLSSNDKSKNKYIYYGSAFLCTVMSFLCKENAAILPFIMFAYFLFFLKPSEIRLDYRKYIILLSSCMVVVLLALLYIGSNPLNNILSGYAARDFTLTERLLTESRVVFHYISLILLPLPSRLNLNYDYLVSHSIIAPPQTLLAIIGIGLLLYGIYYFYHRDRLTSFAIFWFLANLVIESTIIPLELIYEHRLYLPSTFVILCVIYWMYKIPNLNIKVIRGIIITFIIIFSFFTWQRNTVWQSEISLWSDTIKKSPTLGRGYTSLGRALIIKGRYVEAEKTLLTAIKIDPEDVRPTLNLAKVYYLQKRLDKAYKTYQKALTQKNIATVKFYILYTMGEILLKQNDIPQAIEKLTTAMKLNPNYSETYIHLGYAYGMMGQHEKAANHFLKSIALTPFIGHVYIQLAASYEYQKRYQEALSILEESLRKTNIDHSTVQRKIELIKRKMILSNQ